MSKCMTIDESIDQKDTCTEIAPKEIVENILEEVLLSALLVSDKGFSRIGDFNITEDFCQQFDRLPCLRDFEQISYADNQSALNQELNVNSGKSTDRAGSLVTAKENLESIIDSFVNKEERSKPVGECTIITEEVLADNELQIQNGQSHIEINNRGKTFSEATARDYFDTKDVIRDEKIEIQYYNEGKLSKIYVPLIPSNRIDVGTALGLKEIQEKSEDETEERENADKVEETVRGESTEKPFEPFIAEEFRQVFSDDSVDPNRPRACAFGEEDVKKIIKEIEEISFTQSHVNSEDFETGFHPDGQGDADLESKSFTRSKDSLEKISKDDCTQQELVTSNADLGSCETKKSVHFLAEEERESLLSEEPQSGQNDQNLPEKSVSEQSVEPLSEKTFVLEMQSQDSVLETSFESGVSDNALNDFKGNIKGEQHLQYHVLEKECLLKSSLYSDKGGKEDSSSDHALEPPFSVNFPCEGRPSQTAEESEEDLGTSFRAYTERGEKENEAEDTPSWEPTGTCSGSKQDQLPTTDFEPSSEREVKTFQDILPQQSALSLSKLNPEQIEGTEPEMKLCSEASVCGPDDHLQEQVEGTEPTMKLCSQVSDSRPEDYLQEQAEDTEAELKVDSQENGSGLDDQRQNSDLCSDRNENKFEWPTLPRKPSEISKKTENNLQDFVSQNMNDIPDCQGPGENLTEEIEPMRESSLLNLEKTLSTHESHKSLNQPLEPEEKPTDSECSASSSTPSQQLHNSSHSSTGSDDGGNCADLDPMPRNFKLHSQKMYSGVDYEPDAQAQQDCFLTESQEALIDETESVLQVIEPQEHSGDEDSTQVTFSLLCEPSREEFSESTPESLEKTHSSEGETTARKLYSGMTTIGPLKNTDYDPKDLTLPNIDYGRMTRITSSRQLAKEIDLFGTELTSAASVKIVEDDSDNDISVSMEDGEQMEFTSLVNRDIASLTKVQKVREVMSHQPKPEDDFEDDDSLPRPRLDLKDVESMTDERYKVPDVSIPLLSLEIGDSNSAEKELIENMGLVLSSLTNSTYYEEDFEENLESQKDGAEDDYIQISKSKEFPAEKSDAVISDKERSEEASESYLEKDDQNEPDKADDILVDSNSTDSQQNNASSSTKYSTLGSVFRKASSKLIRRDDDLGLRNSKSLPRDTSKITATESIRSILDDCQSSASNMLKKGKSLLKNTQSIFKSMSSSRVTSDPDSGQSIEKKKISPSESDVSTLERKLSSFLRKEDFTKAKNLIKSKVEKTLKHLDSSSSTAGESASSEKKDLQVAVIDEEKLRVDRMENFRKLLPKSPLVYKSQFVKSQISMQNNSIEAPEDNSNDAAAPAEDQQNETENTAPAVVEDNTNRISGEEKEIPKPAGFEVKIPLQEKPQWLADKDEMRLQEEEPEPPQPEYIVMETIQGLPTTDLDSPSSDKENIATESRDQSEREPGTEIMKIEATNSSQACADGVNDIAPCLPDSEDEKLDRKTPSDRKVKTKKKKFTARFRSFWCSAFGKVKTSPKKGDHS